MNFTVLQVFYAVFSGVIEALAIANELLPFGSPFLTLFCLAPLYIALYRSKSYKESFVIFFIQTLTVHLISSYWLANFHGFAAFTLGASAAGTAFEGGTFGIIAWIFPSFLKKTDELQESSGTDCYSQFKRMIWFASVWVLYEYVKSTGAMGYPWGTVSMGAYNWKIFTQIADVTGVWGITFIYVLFSALFAEGISLLGQFQPEPKLIGNYRQCLYFTASLFALAGIYGIINWSIPRIPEKTFNAVLVQQNVDPWESGDETSIAVSKRLTDEAIEKFRENDEKPDLVVWSEGVLSKNFPAARFYYSGFPRNASLEGYISSVRVPFIIGGGTRVNSKKKQYSNSAILFDVDGNYSGFYSKIQLVPFAEKIPYSDNPLMNYFMKNVVGFASTLTSGFQYVLFSIPVELKDNDIPPLYTGHKLYETIALDDQGKNNFDHTRKYIDGADRNPYSYVNFTTPICFEDSFPSVCRNLYNMGSEIFLNITNDSWSKTNSSELQHFIVASYLAIEFRTTLVRCANSGYSVVVDPAGRILKDMPLFEECSGAWEIPVYQRKNTIYSIYGDWLPVMLFIALLLATAKMLSDFHRVPQRLEQTARDAISSFIKKYCIINENAEKTQAEESRPAVKSARKSSEPKAAAKAKATAKKTVKDEKPSPARKNAVKKNTAKKTAVKKTAVKETSDKSTSASKKPSAAKKTSSKSK